MNIWIDILHLPQYNFYKPLIKMLSEEGHTVYLTILKRGKQVKIAQKEIGHWKNIEIYPLGIHRMNRFSALFEANFIRFFILSFWSVNKKIDLVLTNGFLALIIGKIKGLKTYTFGDDPETWDYALKTRFSDQSYYCIYQSDKYKSNKDVTILPVLKEWSYLNTTVFTPNIKALDKYNLSPKEYIFIREVTVGTINYSQQKTGAILNIIDKIPKNTTVLFSLEEKEKRNLYPSEWILLKEPINDIHSLIYYSAGLISSGDSMAREAAILGTNSYYLGQRMTMPANLVATKIAGLNNILTMPLKRWFELVIKDPITLSNRQKETRETIKNTFININKYMYDLVLKEEEY